MAHEGKGEPKLKRLVKKEGKPGSRRMFSPQFKLQVLDSYRQDSDCRGNQRATARKYGIHRRQIQKWLQMEATLRGAADVGEVALNLAGSRQRDDTPSPIPKTDSGSDDSGSESYDQETPLDLTLPEGCLDLSFKRPHYGLYRPYPLCCYPDAPTYDLLPPQMFTYSTLDTNYITKCLSSDAQYYQETVTAVRLYTPMYS